MKKSIVIAGVLLGTIFTANAQTYKFVTTVESVVPGGLGRSRMIVSEDNGTMSETELENFFSFVGIKFENIKNNDIVISTKLSEMEKKGYKMQNVTSGVYSSKDGTGIFITRYIFRKDN